uniref:RNA-directed RNA polymerase n=1 Tax=Erysiphe necator umbra-like virus 2 TaxID=2695368 RepID=A0A7S5I060_9TOMB|nr:RdRp [Erysiphe necator umbra-like virus 2]
MHRLCTPSIGGVWKPLCHTNCAHNFRSGLLQRTLGVVPEPTEAGESIFVKAMGVLRKVIAGRVGILEPWTYEAVIARYSEPRLRKRYEEAARSLRVEGLSTRKDTVVKGFVKAEKTKPSKIYKPRVIMARDPRYNLELASYLVPVEHAVYPAFRGWGKQFYTHTRLIGKGRNQTQRAGDIRRKFEAHSEMVAFEVDGKSFESHLSLTQLRQEHALYSKVMPHSRLAKLLAWQLKFRGRGPGVKFTAEGVRASGDFNTGLGNTLIMCGLVLGCASVLRTKFDFYADGDNAVVFVSRADYPRWRAELPGIFVSMGHEADVGPPGYCLEQVEFGQSRPVFVGSEYRMVRNPFKVMSCCMCSYVYYADIRADLPVLRAVAYCEAVLGSQVPVLQVLAQRLLELTRGVTASAMERVKRRRLDNYEYAALLAKEFEWDAAAAKPVSDASRLSFECAWGVSVQEQLKMEAKLREITIPNSWSSGDFDEPVLGLSNPLYWPPSLDPVEG